MKNSASVTETNTRELEGITILDCHPEDFGDIVDRVGALTEGDAGSILLNMSRIETLKGEGLECLMLARDMAKSGETHIGLCGVSYYVHQLMKVLEITDQVPPVLGAEDEALAALKNGLNGHAETAAPTSEAPGAEAEDNGDDEPEFEFDDEPDRALEDAAKAPGATVVPPEAPAPPMPPPPSDLKAAETQVFEHPLVDQSAVTSKFMRSDFDLPEFEDEDDEAPAPAPAQAGSEADLLAVNFADFVPASRDETIEFEIDGGLAFADTDKFSASEVLDYRDTGAATDGLDLSIASRPTEVFPAFSDLDDEVESEPSTGSASLEGVPDTWLTVDFSDFQPGSGLRSSEGETDPERFDLDFGADSEDLDRTPRLDQTPVMGTPLPFPAAPEDGGYSPIGARKKGENPFKDLSHVPQEPPTQVGLGEGGEAFPILGGQHFSAAETQEIPVPKIEGADLSLIDTQSLPAVNQGETEKLSIMDTQPLDVAETTRAAEAAAAEEASTQAMPERTHFTNMETQEIPVPTLTEPPGFPHDPSLIPEAPSEDGDGKSQEVSSDFFDISKDLQAPPGPVESSVYDTEPMSVFPSPGEVPGALPQAPAGGATEAETAAAQAADPAPAQDFASELVAHVLGERQSPPPGAQDPAASGPAVQGAPVLDDGEQEYSGDDSVILTPEMSGQLQHELKAALGGIESSPYSSEDSMILTPEQAGMMQDQIAQALQEAASAASASPAPASPMPASPAPGAAAPNDRDLKGELERLREAERQRLEAEFAALREAERQRAAAKIEAERRRAEEELGRVREEERRRLEEEMEAIRTSERQRLEEEMARIRETERQRYEQQIEEERQRADRAVSESQAAERRRLEEELERAREEERRRLEAQLKNKQAASAGPAATPPQPAVARPQAKPTQPAASDKNPGAGFKQWAGELLQSRPQAGPEDSNSGGLTPHRELEQFVRDYAISSALHIQILTHLKNNGGRPVGKQEVAAILNGSLALVGQILDDFVQAKIVKRVRAPRIRGGYGYSFSASPKIRGQIIALLRLANDPGQWPVVQKWVSEQTG